MGLDMYLNRFPRYKHYTASDMEAVDSYVEWKKDGAGHSLEEWCGVKEADLPPKDDMSAMMRLMRPRTYSWDKDRKYLRNKLAEGVAYWRKANAIHAWFVDRVQDGEDDCEYHREVSEEDLEDLLEICEEVLQKAVLVDGKITQDISFTEESVTKNYINGKIVANPDVCEELLPSRDGFLFGETDYNEYYLRNVRGTAAICRKLLEETNFEKQMIYYISSW